MIFVTFIAVNACAIKMNMKLGIRGTALPATGILTCVFLLSNTSFDTLVLGAAFCVVGATAYELRMMWRKK
jgi:hypothetical protein